MAIVYKVKKDVKIDDFLNNGYSILSAEMAGLPVIMEDIVYKNVTQEKKSDPVKFAISLLNNKDWQDFNFQNNGIEYFKQFGIKFESWYTEEGKLITKVIENKKLYNYVRNWRLEINFTDEDKWVGFTLGDLTFPHCFYSTEALNKYCGEEIKRLLDLGFIEELTVEKTNNEG